MTWIDTPDQIRDREAVKRIAMEATEGHATWMVAFWWIDQDNNMSLEMRECHRNAFVERDRLQALGQLYEKIKADKVSEADADQELLRFIYKEREFKLIGGPLVTRADHTPDKHAACERLHEAGKIRKMHSDGITTTWGAIA